MVERRSQGENNQLNKYQQQWLKQIIRPFVEKNLEEVSNGFKPTVCRILECHPCDVKTKIGKLSLQIAQHKAFRKPIPNDPKRQTEIMKQGIGGFLGLTQKEYAHKPWENVTAKFVDYLNERFKDSLQGSQ